MNFMAHRLGWIICQAKSQWQGRMFLFLCITSNIIGWGFFFLHNLSIVEAFFHRQNQNQWCNHLWQYTCHTMFIKWLLKILMYFEQTSCEVVTDSLPHCCLLGKPCLRYSAIGVVCYYAAESNLAHGAQKHVLQCQLQM